MLLFAPVISSVNRVIMSLPAAGLMHKFQAHAATDVTGFGLLGHANNLATQQQNEVAFVIHNLPIIAKMAAISKACGNLFNLVQGTSAETSGMKMRSAYKMSVHLSHILISFLTKTPLYLNSFRWTSGMPPQRAGSQVLLRDEEPEHWRSRCSRWSMDNRNCGEGRP